MAFPGAACSARRASARPSRAAAPFSRRAAPASRAPSSSSSSTSSTSSTSASASASSTAAAASGEITIGWIHPVTGGLAGFGVPGQLRAAARSWQTPAVPERDQDRRHDLQGQHQAVRHPVERDPGGRLAKQAIQQDNVDLLLASSTPETVNAVASQAEALGTPLICSNIPWESWYINLGGNPQKPTLKPKNTIMYFLGAEHLALAFKPMWDRIGAEVRQQPQGRRRVPERLRRQRLPRRLPRGPHADRATRSTSRRPTPTG